MMFTLQEGQGHTSKFNNFDNTPHFADLEKMRQGVARNPAMGSGSVSVYDLGTVRPKAEVGFASPHTTIQHKTVM